MSSDPAPCPATETLCGWVENRLEEDDRAALEHHLDSCPACRRAVAEVGRVLGADAATPGERGSTPAPRTASTPPGTLPPSGAPRLGRYEIRREIGMGGMGVVYEGFDPALGRRVALKLLRPDKSGGDRKAFTERLAAEARALAKIAHPNVLTVFDVGVDGDAVFLAAEYVEGVTMDVGWPHRARGWKDRIEAYLQAARGLAAIHAAGLTHRDIKPSNIMLGDDGRVRITDFGLAVGLGEDAAPAGTPAYMAPEQLAGKAGPAADQFALAMCMIEAVNGARAALGATAADLEKKAAAVWAGSAPPRGVWAALAQAISPKAADRFATVDVFIEAISSAITPGPPSRRAGPASRPMTIPSSRGAVAAYAALAVALLAGGIATASALRAPSEGTSTAQPTGPANAAGPAAASNAPSTGAPSSVAAESSVPSPSAASSDAVAPGATGALPSGPAAPGAPAATNAAAAGAPGAAPAFDPEDPLAGLKRSIAVSDKVREATVAMSARDGKTCLQKLDEIATIDPSMTSSYEMYRGQCEMMSGRCEQGLRRLKGTKLFAEQALDHFKATYCPASSLSSPKDRLKAIWLQAGTGKTMEQCRSFEAQLTQILASFGSEKPEPAAVGGAWSTLGSCYVNAGDCTEARRIAAKTVPADQLDKYMENWLGSARDRLCKR